MIQAHPGLNLAIEGHADTTGSADFNMKLSQQRADSVREFLMKQGMSPDTITAKGMGQDNRLRTTARRQGARLGPLRVLD
jgi:outer membrane protein OmpA-like peptidoglycan-associated protein